MKVPNLSAGDFGVSLTGDGRQYSRIDIDPTPIRTALGAVDLKLAQDGAKRSLG